MMLASTALLAAAAASVDITTPLPGNHHAKDGECQSWWCPQLLETKHSTLLFGCCKSPGRGPITGKMARSTDSGKSWTKPIVTNNAASAVYSQTTDTIVMIVSWNASAAAVAGPEPQLASGSERAESGLACTYYLEKYCNADAGKGPTCLDCMKAANHQVLKRGLCTNTQVLAFCAHGTLPPAPPPTPTGPVWASQLPPMRASELAACSAGVSKSTDDGNTWSTPKILMVNNSIGPHYGGNGLNHGIQLQAGPHKGRLALAERFDCPSASEIPAYWRSYVLYSDDEVRLCCWARYSDINMNSCSGGRVLMVSRCSHRAIHGQPVSCCLKDGRSARSRR